MLESRFFNILFRTPLMPASGTFGYGEEFARLYDLKLLGALVSKATTGTARLGNPVPRVAETPLGMLNAIGLENPGVDRVLTDELPRMATYGTPIIVNVAGSDEEEYVEVARKLNDSPHVAALELNISCPNVKEGGMLFGNDARMAEKLVRRVKDVTRYPLLVKLSPNVTDIVEIARAVEAAGADALTMINTVVGMRIDVVRRKPFLSNVTGGLSGPAIKPIALRQIYEVYPHVRIPIIGVGGIMHTDDVLEFFLSGASLVQVGTANFIDPYVLPRITEELPARLESLGVKHYRELIGGAHMDTHAHTVT